MVVGTGVGTGVGVGRWACCRGLNCRGWGLKVCSVGLGVRVGEGVGRVTQSLILIGSRRDIEGSMSPANIDDRSDRHKESSIPYVARNNGHGLVAAENNCVRL